MKFLVSLILATFVGVACMACHPNPANYRVPAGYTRCNTDLDCKGRWHYHEYCGFVGVDTYPVCRTP